MDYDVRLSVMDFTSVLHECSAFLGIHRSAFIPAHNRTAIRLTMWDATRDKNNNNKLANKQTKTA